MAHEPEGARESWNRIAGQAVRGPLAKIVAALDALGADGKTSLSPASRLSVAAALATARRLSDMLESLLAMERFNDGQGSVETAAVGLTTALDPALRTLETRATAAGVEFEWTVNEVGLSVRADEDLLRRAFRLTVGRVMDDVPYGGSVRITAATGGGAVRLRITGSAPTGEDIIFSNHEPEEIGFARLAVERMGGRLDAIRSAQTGSMVDLLLPVPGGAALSRIEPAGQGNSAAAPPAAARPIQPAVTPGSMMLPPVPVAAAPFFPPPPIAMPASASAIDALPPLPAPEVPGAPHLAGMVMTAPWTGSQKQADNAEAPPHHGKSSAAPPDAGKPDVAPDDEPPAKTGGLKITRHVDFDLMSDK